jgi:hypothetical protein
MLLSRDVDAALELLICMRDRSAFFISTGKGLDFLFGEERTAPSSAGRFCWYLKLLRSSTTPVVRLSLPLKNSLPSLDIVRLSLKPPPLQSPTHFLDNHTPSEVEQA